ncbi:MAG: hypothetical protein Kow0077_31260 [Anaerolineae bacterium]
MQTEHMQNNDAPGPASGWQRVLSILFDLRFLQAVGQILFVIILVTAVSSVLTDMFLALEQQNLTPNFSFFETRAGFDIGESPDWYNPNMSYWHAFGVGLINTLRVVSAGLIIATVLGILFGVFLLSTNWLVRTISRVYVEILRNTPLLVQLFVWYFVFVLSLPVMNQALALPGEGVWQIPIRLVFYLLGLILIVRRYQPGEPWRTPMLLGLLALIVVSEFGFARTSVQPLIDAGLVSEELTGSLHGVGVVSYGPFQVYALISVALIVLAYYAPPILEATREPDEEGERRLFGLEYDQVQRLALGVTIGQFLGGILFYFGLLPGQSIRTEVYPLMYLSNRGFVFPEIKQTARFTEWLAFVGLGVLGAIAIWIYYGRLNELTGQQTPRLRLALISIIGFSLVGLFLIRVEPLPTSIPVDVDGQVVMMPLEEAREDGLLSTEDEVRYSLSPFIVFRPVRKGLRFATGTQLSPEYVALLLGLTIYTSAFIAEIVRAGIQAVPKGQIEAARALGLSQNQVLRMIVLPQALRVIIPPLGNQFLNLAKNSTLAIAIGFADFYQVATTVMNQSGQSVTGITIVMLTYLIMSLTISGAANWVNRRFQLVTR